MVRGLFLMSVPQTPRVPHWDHCTFCGRTGHAGGLARPTFTGTNNSKRAPRALFMFYIKPRSYTQLPPLLQHPRPLYLSVFPLPFARLSFSHVHPGIPSFSPLYISVLLQCGVDIARYSLIRKFPSDVRRHNIMNSGVTR